jgi:hypothetical protein
VDNGDPGSTDGSGRTDVVEAHNPMDGCCSMGWLKEV